MQGLATIGVYGFRCVDGFLETLEKHGVDLLIDVRQRRGVRGPTYAWANSRRLQDALAEVGIGYRHHRELAPTTELRHLQYAEDALQGVGKRNRAVLSPQYIDRYLTQILGTADLAEVHESVTGANFPTLFCVETDAPACHRSLVAAALERELRTPVSHLGPLGEEM